MKRLRVVVLTVLELSRFCLGGETNKMVLPPGFENQPGNAALALFSGQAHEFQQLFRASSLPTTSSFPIAITDVAFRVTDGAAARFDATIVSIEIRLSTSSHTPETISTIWGQNKGSDATTVYSHNLVHLTATADEAINPFELKFHFDTPFVYDKAAGNLLMFIGSGGPTTSGASSLDSHAFGILNENSPVASIAPEMGLGPSAYGLITEFTFSSVPEPSFGGLLVVGTIGIFFRVRR